MIANVPDSSLLYILTCSEVLLKSALCLSGKGGVRDGGHGGGRMLKDSEVGQQCPWGL